MLLSRNSLKAGSREGSTTAAAPARTLSLEAAARALAGIRAGAPQDVRGPPLADRLAFLSSVLANPTIVVSPGSGPTNAAMTTAIAALAVAGTPQAQPQQQQQPEATAAVATNTANTNTAAQPMSRDYHAHSQLQQSAVAATLPYIMRAAAEHVRFDLSTNSTPATALPAVVRVAEIGCAAAGNTKLPVQALLAGLAARAHRARRAAAGGRQVLARQRMLSQKRARVFVDAVDGGGAASAAQDDAADDADADAAAAFPLPAQVDLRLVDLPSNDWAAATRTALQLTAELLQGEAYSVTDDAAADDDDDNIAEQEQPEPDSEPVDAAFDDDALAAGGPAPPAAPPAQVFAQCVPASMYDPSGVAPRASLHLIYSNSCAHWQPAQHAPAPAGSDAAAFVSLAPSAVALASKRALRADGGELTRCLEAWRSGARASLAEWLRLRAEELADGGVLVLNVPCADEGASVGGGETEDEDVGEEANSFATWLAPLAGGAVRDLLREGSITPAEAEALTLPACALPEADLRAALREAGAVAVGQGSPGAPAAPAAVFEVLECVREVLPPHPAWYGYRTGAISALDLGVAYAEWLSAVSAPFLVQALAPRLAARGVVAASDSAEAATAVVERLFRRVAERVARDPRPLRFLPVVVSLRRLPRGESATGAKGGFVAAR
jgi:hypothetical protein